MNELDLCLSCMRELNNNDECFECGWVKRKQKDSLLHIPMGTILADKYLIGRVLGQGGFGITYLAYDINLKLKLAIKEFFPQGLVTRLPNSYEVTAYSGEMSDQYKFGMDRFLHEAQTLARFAEHPNIVTVRDFFEANGTAYVVMHYIEGITFEEYLKQEGGKIPFKKSISIMMPVMDALKTIHNEGIMHRDISPDNILINTEGRIIIIDFGAARQDMREKSKSLSVILKAGYAPEEQYRSRGKQGPWTDVYAVAATIYRAITGQVPLESIDRMAEDIIELPSDLGATIEEEEEKYLMKALAVMAADRYRNLDSFQEDIQNISIDTNEKKDNISNKNDEDEGVFSYYYIRCYYCSKNNRIPQFINTKDASCGICGKPLHKECDEYLNNESSISFFQKNKKMINILFTISVVILLISIITYFMGSTEETTTYIGDYKDGLYHGEGVWTHPDGGRYEGEFKDDMFHGEGVWTHPDGERYEGEFKDGYFHGYGIYTFADGAIYEGDFNYDMFHGEGIWTYSDGTIYEGDFNYDMIHGEGVLTHPDGGRYEGEFKDGYLHGYGMYTFPDGVVYEGEFKDDMFHGYGIYTFSDGTVYHDGEWRYDNPIE